MQQHQMQQTRSQNQFNYNKNKTAHRFGGNSTAHAQFLRLLAEQKLHAAHLQRLLANNATNNNIYEQRIKVLNSNGNQAKKDVGVPTLPVQVEDAAESGIKNLMVAFIVLISLVTLVIFAGKLICACDLMFVACQCQRLYLI